MITIVFIIGTRPEAIKMAPIIYESKKYPSLIKSVVVTTSQHNLLLKQVLSVFEISPNYDLKIMKKNQSIFDVTVKVVKKMERILDEIKPNVLIVQGDTTTTFAASLSAYYKKIPVAHVEAGLRTYNKYNPFPEEINRRLTSQIADLHFAPTQKSKLNLLKEGVKKKKIIITGNTVIDALLLTIKKPWTSKIKTIDKNKPLILVTSHRRESFGEGLNQIIQAIKKIAERNFVEILFPVHPNPNVQKIVYKNLTKIQNITLTNSLDYVSFVHYMKMAKLIITDSGGIQEEAPSLGIPVLVVRKVTERPEAIEAGCAILVGTNTTNIIKNTENILKDKILYRNMSQVKNPYGNGKAAKKIIKKILQEYKHL